MSSNSMGIVNLCRLCANIADKGGLKNLFDKSNKIVIEQIKDLTGLTLKDMPRQMLPRCLCTNCTDDLQRACEFRRKIIKTQSYFKSQDYKNKFNTAEGKQEPTFDFVPLNEYGVTEMIETKSFSDDSDKARDDSLAAADCADTIIKEEIKDIKTHRIRDKDVNSFNVKRNRKTKTYEKPSDHLCKSVLKNQDGPCSPLKDEPAIASDKEDKGNPLQDQFLEQTDCKESFFDDNTSDDTCTSSSENHENSNDPNFFVNSKKPKRELLSSSSNKLESDILKDRQYSCHLCQHPIESLIGIKIHFRKQHKREKFRCDLCEEQFSTIKSFERHLRLHQGEKRFKCNYCDLGFKYHSTFVRHERRWHSKDSPFLCTVCGKTFITAYMGKEHMTVHTKERAFHCSVCKTHFLRKTHLRTHYRSVTHKNNEKKFNDELSAINVTNTQ